MRETRRAAAALSLLLLVGGCGSQPVPMASRPAGSPPAVDLSVRLKGETDGTFEVSGFRPSLAKHLTRMDISPDWWGGIFTVRVDGKTDVPPLLGAYRFADNVLSFKPRYPLQRGVRYRAAVVGRQVPKDDGESYADAEKTFLLPKPKTVPTVVEQVYPTRDRVPENLLRFYVQFSAPMRRGDVYQYIRLLDAAGQPVEGPFLTLEQELWDEAGRRFTLLIDPGRIKRGLKPREDAGPALRQGQSYTLGISRDWPDANGEPLKETYRKKFSVLAPDETQPDPKKWKVQAPPAGQSAALVVTFSKPLDHGMLQRVLWVKDAAGQEVEGTIAVTDEETRWRFTPKEAWRVGAYSLVVDTALEDPAGNSIKRPFEVDVFRPAERRAKTETTEVAFTVK